MTEIVVIGAGIVGLACAFHLLRDGHRVTMLDRDPEGDRASHGNAGGIAVPEIIPAAAPGLWRRPKIIESGLGFYRRVSFSGFPTARAAFISWG